MPALAVSAQPGIEETGRVGQQVERRSRAMQALDQLGHRWERMVEHFGEATEKGFDQGLLAGMFALQASRRLGGIADVIRHAVPHRGAQGGPYALPLPQ